MSQTRPPEGFRLKRAREDAGLTQAAAAKSLGIDPMTLSNYERGKRVPSIKTAWAMASLYKVGPDVLLGREAAGPSARAVRKASPAYQVTPATHGFPHAGLAVDGLLWAVEQMSRTITGMVQEARRPEPPKGKRP